MENTKEIRSEYQLYRSEALAALNDRQFGTTLKASPIRWFTISLISLLSGAFILALHPVLKFKHSVNVNGTLLDFRCNVDSSLSLDQSFNNARSPLCTGSISANVPARFISLLRSGTPVFATVSSGIKGKINLSGRIVNVYQRDSELSQINKNTQRLDLLVVVSSLQGQPGDLPRGLETMQLNRPLQLRFFFESNFGEILRIFIKTGRA